MSYSVPVEASGYFFLGESHPRHIAIDKSEYNQGVMNSCPDWSSGSIIFTTFVCSLLLASQHQLVFAVSSELFLGKAVILQLWGRNGELKKLHEKWSQGPQWNKEPKSKKALCNSFLDKERS